MLTKDSIVTFVPGSPGTPSDPGEPAHPAYCTTEAVTEQVFVGTNLACFTNPETGERHCFMVGGHYETRTRYETICYPASAGRPPTPAVPPTPAQWLTNHQIGWNAGAHSVTRRVGDCRATFKVPVASGVIVGLNGQSQGVAFAEIRHGFFFRRGNVQVYELGVPKTDIVPFAATDTFTIERIGGTVRYYQGTTLLYTSLIPSVGSVILDASLYSGGDAID